MSQETIELIGGPHDGLKVIPFSDCRAISFPHVDPHLIVEGDEIRDVMFRPILYVRRPDGKYVYEASGCK